MIASCNYSGAAESDRSLHVHSTSTANVQQGRNRSRPCGDDSPFILDISSSGSKWNVHILLYPLCPILIISVETKMNYVITILHFFTTIAKFCYFVSLIFINLQLIFHTLKARPQTLTRDVPFLSAAISLHQSKHITRHVIHTVYTDAAKLSLSSILQKKCVVQKFKIKIGHHK
jgi:hypothetical protein